MGTARYTNGEAGSSVSALGFGGYIPGSNHTALTEEWSAGDTTVTLTDA
jgi:hypothetical protein